MTSYAHKAPINGLIVDNLSVFQIVIVFAVVLLLFTFDDYCLEKISAVAYSMQKLLQKGPRNGGTDDNRTGFHI
jgi:hypothetical protein